VHLADTPDEFVTAVERALADDSAEQAGRRRSVAEANTWSPRLEELVGIVDEVLAGPGRT